MASDDEAEFLDNLEDFDGYPYTLITCSEKKHLLDAYLQHFKEKCESLFQESTEYDRVPIRDFGDFDDEPKTKLQGNISKEEKIRHRYGIKTTDVVSLGDFDKPDALCWPSKGGVGQKCLKRDPRCRFMYVSLLEQANPKSPLMNLKRDILFRILTYHQVSPCYLNFITCAESYTGARYLSFGGFRAQRFLQEGQRGPSIASLGRSGTHYHLSFKLRSVRKDRSTSLADDPTSRQGAHKYREMTALVFHQFDVKNGNALWILTNPLEEKVSQSFDKKSHGNMNPLWEDVKKSIATMQYKVASDDISERFSASLSVLMKLAEWTIGDSAFYLHYLDLELNNYMKQFVDPRPGYQVYQGLTEDDVRVITHSVQIIENFRYRIEDDCSVLESLAKFFKEELAADLKFMDPPLQQATPGHVKRFLADLVPIQNDLNGLLERAKALEKIAFDRQQYVQRVLENGTNQQMKALTELSAKMAILTSKDSSTMRIFAFITLILLPVTVVSTIFSTPILTFPDEPQNRSSGAFESGNTTAGSSSGPGYYTSWDALKLWGISAGCSTIGCLLLAWALLYWESWTKPKQEPPEGAEQVQKEKPRESSPGGSEQTDADVSASGGASGSGSGSGGSKQLGSPRQSNGGSDGGPLNQGRTPTTADRTSASYSPRRPILGNENSVYWLGKVKSLSVFEWPWHWQAKWRHKWARSEDSPA